jgi:hypothetical protein
MKHFLVFGQLRLCLWGLGCVREEFAGTECEYAAVSKIPLMTWVCILKERKTIESIHLVLVLAPMITSKDNVTFVTYQDINTLSNIRKTTLKVKDHYRSSNYWGEFS